MGKGKTGSADTKKKARVPKMDDEVIEEGTDKAEDDKKDKGPEVIKRKKGEPLNRGPFVYRPGMVEIS